MTEQRFVFTPIWVRVVCIGALTSTLALAVYFTWRYAETAKETWVLVSLSLGQISASGLAIALLVFFSEKDIGALGVKVKADEFLARTLPGTLVFIGYPIAAEKPWSDARFSRRLIRDNQRKSATKIAIRHNSGEPFAFYRVRSADGDVIMRCQLNVGEITVSYYVPADRPEAVDEIRAKLEWATSRYTDIGGYTASWYFSQEAFDGRTYVSVHLSRDFDATFLDNERAKLQVAQDIALSTGSLIKDCTAKGVRLTYAA
ncbi:hypothetical protein [Pseudooceanicola sp. LIPI14-2-Ac024]|uniref:hypothetical protein n=1 Tax=Pseudooceanicola sp. LIPI14-2-Ac024 TaxID=3344875 RepID=UPI0035CEA836